MNKKLFSVSAILAASAVPAFAAEAQLESPELNQSISVEAFYASALEKIYGDGEYLNIGGISFRYTKSLEALDISSQGTITSELFTIVSLGGGSYDETFYEDYYNAKETIDLLMTQIAIGVNLRFAVSDSVSLFAGARVGLAYEIVEYDLDVNGYHDDNKTESDVGFLYGIGVGAEVALTENLNLSLGVDYIGSTAQPELYGIKLEKQSYLQFSLGVRAFF